MESLEQQRDRLFGMANFHRNQGFLNTANALAAGSLALDIVINQRRSTPREHADDPRSLALLSNGDR